MVRCFVLLVVLILAAASASQAQWREVSGITGHSLTSVAIHEGTVFLGTRQGGMFRRSGGELFPVREGLPIGWIESIERDAAGLLYAGLRDDGTYISTDDGATWSRLDINGSITDIASADNWTFLVTDRSFYRSVTGSGTFELVQNEGADLMISSVESDGSIVYAGSYFRVHRSTDFGITWTTAVLPDDIHFSVGVGDMTITPSGLTAIAMRFRFISTDSGLTFSAIIDDREPMVHKAIADGDRLIAALDDGLYTSLDGGRTMVQWLDDDANRFADVAKQGEKIVAITDRKIFTSDDNGVSWSPQTPEISARAVFALAVADYQVFAAADLLYRSEEWAGNFTLARADTTSMALRDLQFGDSWLFALSGPSTILRSSNKGKTWEDISGAIGSEEIPVAAFHVDGTHVFAATYHYGVYYSSDNGDTWSVTTDGGTSGILDNPTVFASFNERIYLATRHNLVESTDRGASWQAVTPAMIDEPIIALSANAEAMYAATSTSTYRLGSVGAWMAGGELPGATVLLAPRFTYEMYAGTAGNGVWASYDDGASWQPLFGLGNEALSGNAAFIHDLAYSGSGFELLAATESNVWIAHIEALGVDDPHNPDLPQYLSARYDRRDGSIHLTLTMPHPAHADIALVDLRGSVVQQLAAGRMEGVVEKSFRIERLPTGTYFITVRTAGGTSSVVVPILGW